MMNNFNSYPLHNEDKSAVRRAYNRFITARNIFENHGRVMCERYMGKFEGAERVHLLSIMAMVKNSGLEATNLHVIKHCNELGV